ncbi:adenosylcobinamide-GDP ribazoletransferase [Halobaculum sp. MBLA0143]|uniref:adenosylcobinamide-GDP ribazoletransferase n=1 Tax=Halobaculum sp. MBLA0143 TaxID=3079933 RepID=UPI00352509EC
MALTAVRGAVGFLSRLPVGQSEVAWRAFGDRPVAFPLAGWLLGGLLATVTLLPGPDATVATVFVVATYLLTGPTHADGVADLGDAAAVHGDPERRRSVMRDSDLGAGGALALTVVVGGLFAAGLSLGSLPVRTAVAVVVASEVAAKTAMATLVCLGTATHEGLASALTATTDARDLGPVVVAAAPATALSWTAPAATLVAVPTGAVVAGALLWWARRTLDGVSGDVFGAANELTRLVAIHAGVVAWTLS